MIQKNFLKYSLQEGNLHRNQAKSLHQQEKHNLVNNYDNLNYCIVDCGWHLEKQPADLQIQAQQVNQKQLRPLYKSQSNKTLPSIKSQRKPQTREEPIPLKKELEDMNKQFYQSITQEKNLMKIRQLNKTKWPGINPLHAQTLDKINKGIQRINENVQQINNAKDVNTGNNDTNTAALGWPLSVNVDSLFQKANKFIQEQNKKYINEIELKYELQNYMNDYYSSNKAPSQYKIPQKHIELLAKYYAKQNIREQQQQQNLKLFQQEKLRVRAQTHYDPSTLVSNNESSGHFENVIFQNNQVASQNFQNSTEQSEHMQNQNNVSNLTMKKININLIAEQHIINNSSNNFTNKSEYREKSLKQQQQQLIKSNPQNLELQQMQLNQNQQENNKNNKQNSFNNQQEQLSPNKNIIYSTSTSSQNKLNNNKNLLMTFSANQNNKNQMIEEWQIEEHLKRPQDLKDHQTRVYNKEFTPIVTYQLPNTLTTNQLSIKKLQTVQRFNLKQNENIKKAGGFYMNRKHNQQEKIILNSREEQTKKNTTQFSNVWVKTSHSPVNSKHFDLSQNYFNKWGENYQQDILIQNNIK